jgi:competence protein ComEC
VKAEKLIREQEVFEVTGMAQVSMPNLDRPFHYGDRVRLVGRLRRPKNFNNPGGFDYRRYLALRKIWVTTFVGDPREIILVAPGQGNPFWIWMDDLRTQIRSFLDEHATGSSGPILKALVLGERGAIPESVREDFAITGAAHIIAISGLHLGIVAFFVFRGLIWLIRRSEWVALRWNIFKLSALLTIPPIFFYTLIAGARITTVRAFIMILIYLISILLDRPRDLLHTLGLAALVITLADPASLLDPSFQLSFTAVVAILVLVPRLGHLFRKNEIPEPNPRGLLPRVAHWSQGLLLVSIAVMIGTGPLIAFHFNRFSPMALATNFVVIPLLGFLAVPASLIAGFFSLFSVSLALPFLWIASWTVDLTIYLVHGLASLPGGSFSVVTPTMFEIGLIYGSIGAILLFRRSLIYRIVLGVLFCSLGVTLSYSPLKGYLSRSLTITSVDVGQGDCTLIEFPGGKRALIDGGGFYDDSFDVGKNVIAPFLWKKKIGRIHFLVLTHPDPDHLNGLKFITRTFRAEELWDSGLESTSPFFQEFMDTVRDKGINRISMFRGMDPRIINDVIIHPLHPQTESFQNRSPSMQPKANNQSLVLKLSYGSQSFLFTGDIEKEAEAELTSSGVDLQSQVIKVPHHGSLTSSTGPFLEKVRPRIALISAAGRGLFKLPNPRVVERYRDLGCQIYRTDQHGAITIKTDGQGLKIETFLKKNGGKRKKE